jgi:hypothetical protein
MLRLDIDLRIEQTGPAGSPANGIHVFAAGREIVVTIDDPSRFLAGRSRRDLAALAPLADGLARRGVSVRVEGPRGTLVRFGDVKSSPVGRMVAGAPHVRLGNPATLLAEVRRAAPNDDFRLPVPPATLFPLVPTIIRNARRRITTTHYLPGSGRPRLIFAVGSSPWDGSRPREFDLLPGTTTIGSSPDADLRLEGLEKIHAEIRHNEDDEYVLYAHAPTGGGRPNLPHSKDDARILRTGSRIEMGPWRLAYYREEFADHGRPYGGRLGGEYEFQKQQPVRPYGSGELG